VDKGAGIRVLLIHEKLWKTGIFKELRRSFAQVCGARSCDVGFQGAKAAPRRTVFSDTKSLGPGKAWPAASRMVREVRQRADANRCHAASVRPPSRISVAP